MSQSLAAQPNDETCPACGGRLSFDRKRAETVCAVCALVVEVDQIDRGPEWRAYDARESKEKSRVGPPRTELLHDNGLSTVIGRRNKDARGNLLSPKQRRRVNRLRDANKRSLIKTSADRSISQGLVEIQRMASRLDIAGATEEFAGSLFHDATAANVLNGRSVESVATACLYIALQKHEKPYRLSDIMRYSNVAGERSIRQAKKAMMNKLSLSVPPVDPALYLVRIASSLPGSVSWATVREALALLNQTPPEIISGRSPYCFAASSLYAASRICGENVTQSTLAESAGVSVETVREQYKEILDSTGHDDFL